jgi:hypothetical protein
MLKFFSRRIPVESRTVSAARTRGARFAVRFVPDEVGREYTMHGVRNLTRAQWVPEADELQRPGSHSAHA